jgi:hypothetical protein
LRISATGFQAAPIALIDGAAGEFRLYPVVSHSMV